MSGLVVIVVLFLLVILVYSNDKDNDIINEYKNYMNGINSNSNSGSSSGFDYIKSISSSVYDYLPSTYHSNRGHDNDNDKETTILSIQILERELSNYENINTHSTADSTADSTDSIADSIDSNRKVLILSRILLGNAGALILASRLAYDCVYEKLDELHLSLTNINDDGMRLIANSINGHKHLKVLHLDGNMFSYDGSLALASSIVTIPTLTYIGLSNTNINRKGTTTTTTTIATTTTAATNTITTTNNTNTNTNTNKVLIFYSKHSEFIITLVILRSLLTTPLFMSLLMSIIIRLVFMGTLIILKPLTS